MKLVKRVKTVKNVIGAKLRLCDVRAMSAIKLLFTVLHHIGDIWYRQRAVVLYGVQYVPVQYFVQHFSPHRFIVYVYVGIRFHVSCFMFVVALRWLPSHLSKYR